eukprot:6468557-Prymnesium_polylepis.1
MGTAARVGQIAIVLAKRLLECSRFNVEKAEPEARDSARAVAVTGWPGAGAVLRLTFVSSVRRYRSWSVR